ncbi:MAG: hypothetical protein P4M14_01995 [Gammaproteobacteria bacterium]|nr:hypothetical protein [Gammaproteobacteria bacterium]
MKIFKLTYFLLAMPSLAFATYPDEIPSPDPLSFHYPKTGVFVVPASEINTPKELKEKIHNNMLQMKAKGYYDSNSLNAKNLLMMKNVNVVALQNKDNDKLSDPQNTKMKNTIDEVGLAFDFKGLPAVSNKNIIGYAAGGMWIEGKGWTGIKEFFNDSELGTCSFSLFNMALSHGNVRIGEDSVVYAVNQKAGTTEVYGSKGNGFTYNVSWYNASYSHELECASPTFNKDKLAKMILYATQIDINLSKYLKS